MLTNIGGGNDELLHTPQTVQEQIDVVWKLLLVPEQKSYPLLQKNKVFHDGNKQ